MTDALPVGLQRIAARQVLLFLLVFALAWSLLLAYTSLTPPMDAIEQLVWVRSLQWGYYKHPPLPTWLLWLPVQVFGWSGATVTGLGALVTGCALALFWSLLARLRGAAFATMALLAVCCITYYNGRLYYYNHNIVLLLASVSAAYACERAFVTQRLVWWAALGAALGLGALAKYQIAITVLCLAAVVLQQRVWRDTRSLRGLTLAAVVALLLFAPHAVWLLQHPMDGPLAYAMSTSLGADMAAGSRWAWSLQWLADQVFNRALPAWLLLAAAMWGAWRRSALPDETADGVTSRWSGSDTLLWSWGLVPLVSMTLLGVGSGANLQLQWGTAFLLFLVPAAMVLASKFIGTSWLRVSPRRLVIAFLALQLLLVLVNVLTSSRGPAAWRDKHWRELDSRAMAVAVAERARAALGGPIRIVVGPAGQGGALALQLPEQPLVLIDGRYEYSPWVAPSLLARCGGVELGKRETLPAGHAFDTALPGWAWRVVMPTDPSGCDAKPRD